MLSQTLVMVNYDIENQVIYLELVNSWQYIYYFRKDFGGVVLEQF